LVVAPLASMLVTLAVILYGRGGQIETLLGLYRFRSQMSGPGGRTVLGWFARQWELGQANFTLPVLVVVAGYLLYRAVDRIHWRMATPSAPLEATRRAFSHVWLFVAPGLLTAAVFTEWFWEHHFIHMWFSLPLAIAAALGLLRLRDL